MQYLLGIDVGASKTNAAIATIDGEIIASTQACGAIYTSNGIDGVTAVVQNAIDTCFTQAKIRTNEISVGVFGMTGVDWSFERTLHERALEAQFPQIGRIIVCNDSVIAFHAAAKSDWGTVLVSGSGFNAAAFSPKSEDLILGYYVDAPHCGGKSLSRRIIKTVCNSHVGLAEPTALTETILEYFGAADTDDLLMHYLDGKYETEKLLTLPAKLFACYETNDAVAIELVDAMYRELANHAVALSRKLGWHTKCPDVVLSGGMLKAAPSDMIDRVTSYVRPDIPGSTVYTSRYEPVFGALKIGMKQLGKAESDLATLYSSADGNEHMVRESGNVR